jgi:urease subunit gamma
MDLSPRELDELHVYQVAGLARRRRDRGTELVSWHDPIGGRRQ